MYTHHLPHVAPHSKHYACMQSVGYPQQHSLLSRRTMVMLNHFGRSTQSDYVFRIAVKLHLHHCTISHHTVARGKKKKSPHHFCISADPFPLSNHTYLLPNKKDDLRVPPPSLPFSFPSTASHVFYWGEKLSAWRLLASTYEWPSFMAQNAIARARGHPTSGMSVWVASAESKYGHTHAYPDVV